MCGEEDCIVGPSLFFFEANKPSSKGGSNFTRLGNVFVNLPRGCVHVARFAHLWRLCVCVGFVFVFLYAGYLFVVFLCGCLCAVCFTLLCHTFSVFVCLCVECLFGVYLCVCLCAVCLCSCMLCVCLICAVCLCAYLLLWLCACVCMPICLCVCVFCACI